MMQNRGLPERLRHRLDRFGHVMAIMATLAFALLHIDALDLRNSDLRDLLGWGILAAMALEVTLRLALEGIEATRRLWSMLDALIVLVAGLTQTPVLVVLRLVFVVRLFPFQQRITGFLLLGCWARRLVRDLARAAVVMMAGIFVLSLLASELLAGLLAAEFGSLFRAMETLTRIILLDAETLKHLIDLAGSYPVIWMLMVMPWLLIVFLSAMILSAPFVDEAIGLEQEAEVTAEALNEMHLMQLETGLLKEEIAVEGQAERLLIRAETNRILKEIGSLKGEIATYRRRYGR